MKIKLEDLPYGTVIEYRKERYWITGGVDGTILMCERFGWRCLKDPDVQRWKKFRILLMGTGG